MRINYRRFAEAGVFVAVLATAAIVFAPHSHAVSLPDPKADMPLAADHGSATTVFAGGCFWGMQGVFQHVKGVTRVTAGYAGGSADTAEYETVSTGTTGHAESVQITWDPAQISFGQLLKVYFGVAHDPTQLNHQDPDEGTQYRSEIFFTQPEQQKVAADYVAQLDAAKAFPQPIVTQIAPLKGFYAAEGYHQDYLQHHPNQPYIAMYDMPKIAALKHELPGLYVDAVTN
jgi:peptide-methionine (S)-S-oxide reductase